MYVLLATVIVTRGYAQRFEGCPVFPADNIWNTSVDTLPLDKNSDLYIDTMGRDEPVHPDFGARWEGMPIGIPYMVGDKYDLVDNDS